MKDKWMDAETRLWYLQREQKEREMKEDIEQIKKKVATNMSMVNQIKGYIEAKYDKSDNPVALAAYLEMLHYIDTVIKEGGKQ